MTDTLRKIKEEGYVFKDDSVKASKIYYLHHCFLTVVCCKHFVQALLTMDRSMCNVIFKYDI